MVLCRCWRTWGVDFRPPVGVSCALTLGNDHDKNGRGDPRETDEVPPPPGALVPVYDPTQPRGSSEQGGASRIGHMSLSARRLALRVSLGEAPLG